MKEVFDNEMKLEFISKSSNEAFARIAVAAFASQLDPTIEELADIEEVIIGILNSKNVTREELETIRQEKVKKRGAFKSKIYLEGVKFDYFVILLNLPVFH